MAFLIAVAGLSGAGKTTAIDHLASTCPGEVLYLGGMVLAEVRKRGLSSSPDIERKIRADIRKENGPAALAILGTPRVTRTLNSGVNILIDAIFTIEEYHYLQKLDEVTNSILIAIEAPFETRYQRVSKRDQRQLTRTELEARDTYEISNLGTPTVMAEANYVITNDGPIESFQEDLEHVWRDASSSSGTIA